MSPISSVKEALPRLVGTLRSKPPALPEALVHQLPRIIEPVASLPPLRRLASKLRDQLLRLRDVAAAARADPGERLHDVGDA